jgi:hypothetical protein
MTAVRRSTWSKQGRKISDPYPKIQSEVDTPETR